MARTKKTTINNVEYTFQSVTFSRSEERRVGKEC